MNASAFILKAPPRAIFCNSKDPGITKLIPAPIMVGMMTTSPSENMDMISRVAEKGIGVSSSGMYGAT